MYNYFRHYVRGGEGDTETERDSERDTQKDRERERERDGRTDGRTEGWTERERKTAAAAVSTHMTGSEGWLMGLEGVSNVLSKSRNVPDFKCWQPKLAGISTRIQL